MDTSGQVGYAEGYTEVSARDVLGGCPPVDCRIVRRCNPIINLLFTPCTFEKRNVRLLSKIRRVYRSITPLYCEMGKKEQAPALAIFVRVLCGCACGRPTSRGRPPTRRMAGDYSRVAH